MVDLASTGLRRFTRLDSKLKQKYGLFYKFALAVIVSWEVATKRHIFLTISNQHIQKINRHFYVTLNTFGPMFFAEN